MDMDIVFPYISTYFKNSITFLTEKYQYEII
jgi:hypothetical protein